MLAILFTISLTVVACQGDVPVAPPVRCGFLPDTMFTCIGTPKVIKPGVSNQCDKNLSECDRITCIFRKSGWMDGDNLDKQKYSAHFDQFAKDYPEWQAAVDSVKMNCLTAHLPPQGIHINCPAYDAMQCTFASFIRNVQPSQWVTTPSCDYPRQFAAACPICPSSCFSPLLPIGSCNACLSLPKSP